MKKLATLIIITLLISLATASAKEYYLGVGDKVTFEGKTITLNNVGSGGAINIDIDGLILTISASATQEVGDLKIQNLETFYDSNDVSQRSATLEIFKPGVVCYQDNFCEDKIISFHGDTGTYGYKDHAVKIIDNDYDTIIIEVDGKTETLQAPWVGDLSKTVTLINGLGVRYDYGETYLLYLGENFDNCLSDCPLEQGQDYRVIKAFCENGEKDEETHEDGVDCKGLCSKTCGYIGMPCEEDNECKSGYICHENKCFECPKMNVTYCETGLFVPLGENESTTCNLGYTCCGDGVCDGKENEKLCPPDCYTVPEEVFCPQDAKLCPDRSYVSRVAPDCSFAKCPIIEKEAEEEVEDEDDDKEECGGCLDGEECLDIGSRMGSAYCKDKDFVNRQKENGEICNNDYECLSDNCLDNICSSVEEDSNEEENAEVKAVNEELVKIISFILNFFRWLLG